MYASEMQMSERGSEDRMDDRKRSNRSLLKRLVAVVVVMFGFGFALVPFYDQICKATGLRDIDAPDEVKNMQVDMTRSVRLELRNGDSVRFGVADDGAGFDPGIVRPSRFGIQIMRERAHAVGASFELSSSPGSGTRVEVLLP